MLMPKSTLQMIQGRWLILLLVLAGLSVLGFKPLVYAYAEDPLVSLVNGALVSDASEPSSEQLSAADTDVIAAQASPNQDIAISQRIRGIFSEIEGLDQIQVQVREGVVVLVGSVPNDRKGQQAVQVAERVGGVVVVEDQIERTLDVQENVAPVLGALQVQVKTWIKAAPLLLVAGSVFALLFWFGVWLSRRQKLWTRLAPNSFVAELMSQTMKVVFFVVGLVSALSLLGAQTLMGTLLGGAGVIGIAVGFAVKDTIENYIASMMLSVRQPFRPRDHIVINGQEGIVVRLTSRATILMTQEGNQLRIPNSEVFKGTILNYTHNPDRRITFVLGIDADDDPLAAIKVGLDALRELKFILAEPNSSAVITQVGDSNIELEFRAWVDQRDTDVSKARTLAIRATKQAVEASGFSLPEPIYRLRFDDKLQKALQDFAGDNLQATDKKDALKPCAKLMAHKRAQAILAHVDEKDILDAQPDKELLDKIEQEIAYHGGEKDLLDPNSPHE